MSYKIDEGTLEIPVYWNDLTTNEFGGASEDNFRFQIIRNSDQLFHSAADAMADAKETLLAVAGNEVEILEERDVRVSDRVASSLSFTSREGGDLRITRMAMLMIGPKKSLTFIASAPSKVWSKYSTEFQKVLESFRLELE